MSYFSRIELQPHVTQDFWRERWDLYRVHQLLWGLFSDQADRKRDFLYREERREGRPVFYTLSARPPNPNSPYFRIDGPKYFAPRLTPDALLGFSLRVNPVRTRDLGGRSVRCDIVMDEKHRLKTAGLSKTEWPSQQEIAQTQGMHWLLERAEKHGFELAQDSVRADTYQIHRFPRKGRMVQFATLDFTGALRIKDSERLGYALYHGIGPAKSFGCGLLLLRRI